MGFIVQKYGGSSLAKPEQIQDAAVRIKALREAGHDLLIVVSAMGKTTDQLVELAYKVSPEPNRRELDMLLTTGERISMALMSMALNDRGVPAISFTGSQAGVLTDELHSNARIVDLKPIRVQTEISRRNVVVLAGFQGVSPKTKEVTTLGRGGSDTTAVALAAYFKADRCEIRKDVDGVHSADPNLVSATHHIPHLHYRSLLDMTYWGAKVLHYRSVELAALLKIPVMIALAHGDGGQATLIDDEAVMYEQARVLSVNSHKEVKWIEIEENDVAKALQKFSLALKGASLPIPQLLDTEKRETACRFLIAGPAEALTAIAHMAERTDGFKASAEEISTVTATCQGTFSSPFPEEIASTLSKHEIPVQKLLFSAMSITAVVQSKHREKAIQVIHSLPR